MKTGLIVLFALATGGLQAQTPIFKPRYLTDHQLPPTAVTVSVTRPVSPSGAGFAVDLDSWAVPLFMTERANLLAGAGGLLFTLDHQVYTGGWLNLFSAGSIGDSGYWLTAQSVGSTAEVHQFGDQKSLAWFQISFIGWKPSGRSSAGIGLLSRISGSKPVFVPAVLLAWEFNDQLIFSAWLPSRAELEYQISDNTRLQTGLTMTSKTVSTPEGYRTWSEIRAGAGVRQKLWTWTWLTGGITRSFSPAWQKTISRDNIRTYSPFFSLEAGIQILPD